MKFESILRERCCELSAEAREKICQFYGEVLRGNQSQNLTRVTDPQGFFDYHVRDALELIKSGQLSGVALDVGSGAGVPGLLSAILEPERRWIAAESEKKKAEHLESTKVALKLSNVQVYPGRAEAYLKAPQEGWAPKTLVSRAVGSVAKIYRWVREGSTWNRLVLFKSRAWEDEWLDFSRTNLRKELAISACHQYQAGPEGKDRKIICLTRTIVPRGTTDRNSKG